MRNCIRAIAGPLLTTATLASSAAFAGLTGNVGGIRQSTGAALRGGIDYAHASGLYVGS